MSIASKGPDFLVIGAQRAGTTWLHRVLRQHPALWLPPVKELHYFDPLDIKRTIMSPKERRRVGLKRLLSLDPWLIKYWFLIAYDKRQASRLLGSSGEGTYRRRDYASLRDLERESPAPHPAHERRDKARFCDAGPRGSRVVSSKQRGEEESRRCLQRGTVARTLHLAAEARDRRRHDSSALSVRQIRSCQNGDGLAMIWLT